MEAFNYPFYGVQYHPEKITYNPSHMAEMPNTKISRQMVEELSYFFIDECRKNLHTY